MSSPAPDFEPVVRLSKDLANAAKLLSREEVRYLVDSYYQIQDIRKASSNQVGSIERAAKKATKDGKVAAEPTELITWLTTETGKFEDQIKRGLQKYAENQRVGRWALSVYGIGPIIAAGLPAHIDIEKAPTVGHIWRFAGQDPTLVWLPKTKRPFNASLKVLCCHPATIITTSKGATTIENVCIGDEVLTHSGRFKKVIAVHQNNYDGYLVALKAHGNTASPLYVTDNHPVHVEIRKRWTDIKGHSKPSFAGADRILRSGSLPDEQIRVMREQRESGSSLEDLSTQYGCSVSAVSMICNLKSRAKPMENEKMWVRADGIMSGWLLNSPRLPEGDIQTVVIPKYFRQKTELPDSIFMDTEMAHLFGLFAAEGHVSGNHVGFSFHKNELEYQQFVKDVMFRRFNLVGTETVNGNSYQIIFFSMGLARLLVDIAGKGAFTKKVPISVLNGPAMVRASFLRGWFEGDGCLNDFPALTTSSEAAVHDAHALLLSLGVTSSVCPYQRSFKLTVSDAHNFDVIVFGGELRLDSSRHSFRRVTDANVWTQATESGSLKYDGPVFNLEVEEDHSYTANGFAVHNCWKIGQSFLKFSNAPECMYGRLLRTRWELEKDRNFQGLFVEQARDKLVRFKIDKSTDAYKWYSGQFSRVVARQFYQHAVAFFEGNVRQIPTVEEILEMRAGKLDEKHTERYTQAMRLAGWDEIETYPEDAGTPMLPPAHILQRACRYATKLFLSHYHEVAWESKFNQKPVKPYVFDHLTGHQDLIHPPGWPCE